MAFKSRWGSKVQQAEQRDGLAQGVEPVAALLGVLPPAQDRQLGGRLGPPGPTGGRPAPLGDLPPY
jgi:hypothetical protein